MREDFNDLPGGTSDGHVTGGNTLRCDLVEACDRFAEVIAAASRSGGNIVQDFGSLGAVTLTGVVMMKLAADDLVFR
jgi:hypothetical protein